MLLNLKLPERIDLTAAARYMGGPPDAATLALLTRLEPGLLAAASPRAVWQPVPLDPPPPWLTGRDIFRHLAGCGSALLLAVTLGSRCDDFIRRAGVGDVAAAAGADALASALTEQLAHRAEQALRDLHPGQYLTGRFSPGYGDWPVTVQGSLCAALDAHRTIGLTATDTSLLLPRKSVTALLGVSQHPVTGARAGCQHCVLAATCQYRKRGITCE
jgi:hypothetical protein